MKTWDLFISHASEDKQSVAIPLTELLERAGLKVWLDQREITLGDSLRLKINDGLAQSRFGLVILSQAFLSKRWPTNELNSLLALEDRGRKVLLPVLHELELADLAATVPLLADRLSVRTQDGLEAVAKAILQAVRVDADVNAAPSPPVIAFDLSHRQSDWYYLEDFARTTKLRLDVLRSASPDLLLNLSDASVLVLPLPCHCSLSAREIQAVDRWVYRGGRLLLMGFYAADIHHQGSNPSALLRVFGAELGEDLIMPAGRNSDLECRVQTTTRKPDLAVTLQFSGDEHPITKGVKSVAFQSACSVKLSPGTQADFMLSSPPSAHVMRPEGQRDAAGQMPVITQWVLDRTQSATLVAAFGYGQGRVVAVGTWKLCTLEVGDNLIFVENIVNWLRTAP